MTIKPENKKGKKYKNNKLARKNRKEGTEWCYDKYTPGEEIRL